MSKVACTKCKIGRANCSYEGDRGAGGDYGDVYSLSCETCGHREEKIEYRSFESNDTSTQCPYCKKEYSQHSWKEENIWAIETMKKIPLKTINSFLVL